MLQVLAGRGHFPPSPSFSAQLGARRDRRDRIPRFSKTSDHNYIHLLLNQNSTASPSRLVSQAIITPCLDSHRPSYGGTGGHRCSAFAPAKVALAGSSA